MTVKDVADILRNALENLGGFTTEHVENHLWDAATAFVEDPRNTDIAIPPTPAQNLHPENS